MESTLTRTWAEINFDALKHNYTILRNRIGHERKFLGVVKADAYGHGSVQVAEWLEELGADYLAVSSLDEAMELRLNNISMPLLILGHTPSDQVEKLIKYDITQCVTAKAKAVKYSNQAIKLSKSLKVHIKVDTGMSRLGYLCDKEYFETGLNGICDTLSLPGLEVEGIFTHFAMSDVDTDFAKEYTNHQFELFTNLIDAAESKSGKKFKIRHCANTGAVASYPETWLDMVRPGLLLYGYGDLANKMGLFPVMSLKTVINTIKVYPEDTYISYGGIYHTEEKTRVGVLPIGYADGLMRILSDRFSLMSKDGPVPQIGRICMDMCMINLNDYPLADVGDELEIFGRNNPIEVLSDIAQTIPYELTCNVSKRVPRFYVRDGEIVGKDLLLRSAK